MEPSQNTISLKMIPRIDYDRIKARMSLVPGGHTVAHGWGGCSILLGAECSSFTLPTHAPSPPQKDWFAKRKKFKRPPQRLFDAEKIR